MSQFSRRSRHELKLSALTVALAERRASGAPVLDLCSGNPTAVGLSPSAEQLAESLCAGAPTLARYRPDPFGGLRARELICQHLAREGRAADPASVMLSACTSDAYAYLFKLLCDAGDEILVPTPSYPLLHVLAQLEQVKLVPYELGYDGQWYLDTDSLRKAQSARSRAIVVVHPNNPTGSLVKRQELAALAALGLPIISDEVFAGYGLDPAENAAHSALDCAADTLVFRLEGLSKSLALPQLKLAWTVAAGPEPALREATERLAHIADAHLAVSGLVEATLAELLPLRTQVQTRIRARCRRNLALLRARVGPGSALSVLRVEAGWYALLRLPAVQSDEAWTLSFLHNDGVAVQPGYLFDLDHGAYVVLSLITPEPLFAEGVARIVARVEREIEEARP